VAELESNGIAAQDIPGGKGQFDVVRDGELVFSKHETGRFPENDEVVALLS
jgi:selT/selW/selH-like putative selenoprotein